MLLIKLVNNYFQEIVGEFRTIFGKFENEQKTLGKRFWTNFLTRKILGEF